MAQVQQPQPEAEIDPIVELETQIDGLLVEMERETKALDEIEARRKDAASRSMLMERESESESQPVGASPAASEEPVDVANIAPALTGIRPAEVAPAVEPAAVTEERVIEAMLNDAAEQASAGEPSSPAPSGEAAVEDSAAPEPEAAAGVNKDDDLSAALTRALAEAENRAQELAAQLGPEERAPAAAPGEPPLDEAIGVRTSFASAAGNSAAPAPVVGSATPISALDAELALGATESTSNSDDEYAALEAALEQATAQAAPAASSASAPSASEGPSLDELSDAVTSELTAAAAASAEPVPVAAASGFESVDDVVDKVLNTQAAAAQPPVSAGSAKAVIQHQAPTMPVMVAAAGVGTPPITESAAATAAALRSPTLAPAPTAKPAAGDDLLKAHVVGTGNSIGRTIGALCNVFALPLKPFSGAVRDYVGYFGLITAFYGVCVIAFAFIRAANMPPEPDLPKPPGAAEHAGGHDPHAKDAHDHGAAHAEPHGNPAAPIELRHNDHAGHAESAHHESATHDAHAPTHDAHAPQDSGGAEPRAEGSPAPEHHEPAEHTPPAKPH